jgi:VanZ family protein
VGVTAWLLLAPMPPMPGWLMGIEVLAPVDRTAHVGLFGLLTVMPQAAAWGRRRSGLVAAVLVAAGVGLEVAQMWTDSREADVGDAMANAAGVGLGVLAGWTRELLRRKTV